MSKFIKFFSVYFRKNIKNIPLMVSMIILPLCVYALCLPTSPTQGVNVGMYAVEDGEYERQIMSSLEQTEGYNFLRYEDEDEMIADVESGDLSLGYTFERGFSAGITEGDPQGIVSVVMFADNMYASFIDEHIYNEIFTAMLPHSVQDYLQPTEYTTEEIQSLIDHYASAENAFSITTQTLEGEIAQDPVNAKVINGVICLYLLMLSLVTCMNACAGKTAFLPYMSTIAVRILTVLPTFVLTTLCALVSVIIAGSFFQTEAGLASEVVKLLVYQASLLPVSLLIAGIIKKNLLVVLLPFIFIFVLLTHPIFFDITSFFPELEVGLRVFATYNYLDFSPDVVWAVSNVLVVAGLFVQYIYYKKRPT